MLVAFVYTFTCPSCAKPAEGVICRTVRVNKNSLRSTGPGLGIIPRDCKGCGSPLPEAADSMHLDRDDLAKVNEARQRKGWPPLPTTTPITEPDRPASTTLKENTMKNDFLPRTGEGGND